MWAQISWWQKRGRTLKMWKWPLKAHRASSPCSLQLCDGDQWESKLNYVQQGNEIVKYRIPYANWRKPMWWLCTFYLVWAKSTVLGSHPVMGNSHCECELHASLAMRWSEADELLLLLRLPRHLPKSQITWVPVSLELSRLQSNRILCNQLRWRCWH